MTQILKRLEIIKSGIAIKDEEIIKLQITKLQKLNIDNYVKIILEKLQDMNYANALEEIETYLLRYSDLQGLKLELKDLESSFQELVEQKIEYLNEVEEFNYEYNIQLGGVIKDVLSLNKEILYNKIIKQQKAKEKYKEKKQTFEDTKVTIDELRYTIAEFKKALKILDGEGQNYDKLFRAYEELKEEVSTLEFELKIEKENLEETKEYIEDDIVEQEYIELKSNYKEFEGEYKRIKEFNERSVTLNDDEKKELKLYFRKASRLCHPEVVSDYIKEKAHEFMQQLNKAYIQKDLSKVKEIFYNINNESSFKVLSEIMEDKKLLEEKIKKYSNNIKDIESELEELQEDETYQTIVALDDWGRYFEELKNGLEEEKQRLENKREVWEF